MTWLAADFEALARALVEKDRAMLKALAQGPGPYDDGGWHTGRQASECLGCRVDRAIDPVPLPMPNAWNVPYGQAHPKHPGWTRIDEGPLTLAFRGESGIVVEIPICEVLAGPDAVEAQLSRLITCAGEADAE